MVKSNNNKKRRNNRNRISISINGLLNSAIRTVANVYFLLSILIYYFLSTISTSLDWLTTVLDKIKLIALSKWVKENHFKASTLLYFAILCFTIVPSRASLFYLLVSIVLVYYSKSTTATPFVILAFFLIWFSRTSSPKIKVFIVIICLVSYSYGWWGTDAMF